jgi:signal peptidase II
VSQNSKDINIIQKYSCQIIFLVFLRQPQQINLFFQNRKKEGNMLYIIIITVLTLIDQFTKSEMLSVADGSIGYSIPVIPGFFHFTYVENHGGIFGLFQGKIGVFTVVSLLLLGYIVFTEYKNFKNYTKWTKIGVSIIAAGAMGNMIDRIFRGFVVDMIDFNGLWHFVFNVADMYVHIGIYIIVIDYLVRKYMEKNRK